MSMHVIRAHYFVGGLRLMFLIILEYCLLGSVMKAEVLLNMSVLCCSVAEYHVRVAVVTAVAAIDVV